MIERLRGVVFETFWVIIMFYLQQVKSRKVKGRHDSYDPSEAGMELL